MRNLREKSKRTENTRLETRNEDLLKQATVINHSKSSLISNDNASKGVSRSNVLKTCQSFSKTLFKNFWNLKQYFTIILVQSLPSECKDKLLNLLSPSASKGCS